MDVVRLGGEPTDGHGPVSREPDPSTSATIASSNDRLNNNLNNNLNNDNEKGPSCHNK
jgi:hypothetical protein